MDKHLLTIPDFCGRYSISRTVTYHEIKQGRLRPTKVGRRTYIAAIDAQAWLDLVRKTA
ncbi:MAG: helix-turn-helix domain-containing protein [Rhodospirillales bacterium]|nr:helix-turn-helix domain-containing protein [Rhodospirillales bacterium]